MTPDLTGDFFNGVVKFALLLVCCLWNHASAFDAASCDATLLANIPGIRVDIAEVVDGREDLPVFCRVTGQFAPSIGFEMRLPVQDWNGRFMMAGCGAFCGKLLPEGEGYSNSINFAVKRGYAASITDSGHQASPTDTSWAYNNEQAEQLYAHGWVPLAATGSRAILQKFYGKPERYSYFSGCSNGGRTALKVAQVYPGLFDGIASGAPGINVTFAAGILGVFFDRTLVDENGELILHADKVPMLSEAVKAQCDALDGLTDGIVSNPWVCDFRPETLLCADDANDTGCLTSAEVNLVNALYEGLGDSHGNKLYYGLPRGSEQYWERWLLGASANGKPHVTDLGSNFLRYLGFKEDPGPEYKSSEFDLNRDIPRLEVAASRFNATNPNLESLRQSNSKLLMYHGLADPLTVPEESISYYERVVNEAGSAAEVNDFYRLFLIPGADHCWGVTGSAIDLFDPLQVLEAWVEEGKAPDQIIAVQHAEPGLRVGVGPVLRSRTLCPYPKAARYTGQGSAYSAENFECVAGD